MAKIRVVSLDFDGCVFNEAYLLGLAKLDIVDKNISYKQRINVAVEANQNFLDDIAKEHADYAATIFMVGSNRQSHSIDENNLQDHIQLNAESPFFTRPSAYPTLTAIRDYVKSKVAQPRRESISIDKYLLADTYGKKQLGESFKMAKKANKIANGLSPKNPLRERYEHADAQIDGNKVYIMLAQTQHIAAKRPNDLIDFDFYDDTEEIVDNLVKFFQKEDEENSEKKVNLISLPANVNLKIYHRDPYGKIVLKGTFTGTGPIVLDYQDSIRYMPKLYSGMGFLSNWTKYYQEYNQKLRSLDPTLIETFKENLQSEIVQQAYNNAIIELATNGSKRCLALKTLLESLNKELLKVPELNYLPNTKKLANAPEFKTYLKNVDAILLQIDRQLMSAPQKAILAVMIFIGTAVGGFGGFLAGALLGGGNIITAAVGAAAGGVAGGLVADRLTRVGIFKYNNKKMPGLNSYVKSCREQINDLETEALDKSFFSRMMPR